MRTVVLLIVLTLALAARLPWLVREASDAERMHAGAARHLVLHRDRSAPALRADPPAASHLGSPLLWTLRSPAPAWDAAGPPDQIGWRAVRDTQLPHGEVLPPGLVTSAMRLPFLLLHLMGVFLLFRLGERFYGTAAGAVAAALVAVAPEPCVTAATATPATLAVPVTVLLLAALDDFAAAIGYEGRPPPWLLRKRTLALGVACGLALGTSYAFVPLVLVSVVWVLARRRAHELRGDACQPPSLSRRVLGVAVAGTVVWGLYLGDVAPYPEVDLTLPAPLWWAGAVDAARDAAAVPWSDRLVPLRAGGGPTLLAIGALAVLGYTFVRRDLTDAPSLFVTLGLGGAAASLLLAPRHAPVAVAAALPGLALLAGAWLVRLSRHQRVACATAGLLLLVGLAAGWAQAAPWRPAPPDGEAGPARLTSEEKWLLDTWVLSREPSRVITVLGREPRLRVSGASRVEEIDPETDDGKRLMEVWKQIDAGADVALVFGDWTDDRAPDEGVRAPDARFGRLSVYGRR
jgi:hypothetical protein